jgi:hypothetical protein
MPWRDPEQGLTKPRQFNQGNIAVPSRNQKLWIDVKTELPLAIIAGLLHWFPQLCDAF